MKKIVSGEELKGRIHVRPLVHTLLNTGQYWRYAKQKEALVKVVIWVAKILPEPRMDNLIHPNSRRLQKERELFQKYETNPNRRHFIDAVFKLVIIGNEQGGYYRKRGDRVLKDIIEDGWEFEPVKSGNECWCE